MRTLVLVFGATALASVLLIGCQTVSTHCYLDVPLGEDPALMPDATDASTSATTAAPASAAAAAADAAPGTAPTPAADPPTPPPAPTAVQPIATPPSTSALAPAPLARIADLDWMVGGWVGEGLGGRVEELFLPAVGGAMPGTFRATRDGRPRFYEFFLYEETEGGIQMLIHHFGPGMTRWEDDPVAFDLTSISAREPAISGPREATFAKRNDPDQQTHLTYRRDADRLTAELSRLKDGDRVVVARFAYTLSEIFKPNQETPAPESEGPR